VAADRLLQSRLQGTSNHFDTWRPQLLSTRPECRTRDGRLIRAYRRVFRPRYEPEAPPFEYDWQRTMRLAAFGGAIAGPMGHVWFQLLDSRIMPHAPRRFGAFLLQTLLICDLRSGSVISGRIFAVQQLHPPHPGSRLPSCRAGYRAGRRI